MIISVTMWLWVMLLIYAIQLRFLCLWIFKLACVSFIIGFGSVHTLSFTAMGKPNTRLITSLLKVKISFFMIA
jgi:hypothetical protein